jgi:hypothetical protein
METYAQDKKGKPKKRNIIVSAHSFGKDILNFQFLSSLLLTYLFYVGSLVLAISLLMPDIFENKMAVFIIAFAFTFIDKGLKPFIFFFDLITFTFHRIGLFTILTFSVTYFILGNYFSERNTNLSVSDAVLVVIIILIVMAIIDFIDKQSLFKTKMTDESNEIGSDINE